MKLCKDCNWFREPTTKDLSPENYSQCFRTSGVSPVTGAAGRAALLYCTSLRSAETFMGNEICGPSAKWWEPKKETT